MAARQASWKKLLYLATGQSTKQVMEEGRVTWVGDSMGHRKVADPVGRSPGGLRSEEMQPEATCRDRANSKGFFPSPKLVAEPS